jgi:hypothetical protein
MVLLVTHERIVGEKSGGVSDKAHAISFFFGGPEKEVYSYLWRALTMQYQQAVRLGVLHQQLGIAADARIFLQIKTDGPGGAYIWDLDTGNTYMVSQGTVVGPGSRDVPQHVKDIIAATDQDLKAKWLSTMGWDEVRETIFSELSFRGVNILELEGIG